MVHNRKPDDEYAQDVQEARRLIALNESMHNGEYREQRGDAWYGSPEMLEYDRAVTHDMGILLARIMEYADKVRAERDRYIKIAYGIGGTDAHMNKHDPDSVQGRGEVPTPCDDEIYRNGEQIALLDGHSWAIEEWIQKIASESNARVDWHYFAGRGRVLFLGDAKDRERVLSAMRDTKLQLRGDILWMAD